jgi:hypothetical protein
MTRSRNRSGRVLDALVVALAVPTVAIAATLVGQHDLAHEHALVRFRPAVARCDGARAAATAACRSDAAGVRRNAAFGSRSADEVAQQSADVADALARAQCDVLAGNSTDACGGTQGAHRGVARAEPAAHLAAADAHEGFNAANPRPPR